MELAGGVDSMAALALASKPWECHCLAQGLSFNGGQGNVLPAVAAVIPAADHRLEELYRAFDILDAALKGLEGAS